MIQAHLARTTAVLRRAIDEDRAATAAQLCAIVDGTSVVAEALGRLEPEQAVTPETMFKVYCAIKPVAALAIGHLIDQGRVALDQPLREHLSGVGVLDAHDITLRHLLSHTAGLHEVRAGHMEFLTEVRRRRFVDRLQLPPDWEIGVDTGYSEFAAWHLLGRLIEGVTDEPLRLHLRDAVLDPLGLHRTRIGMTAEEYVRLYPDLGVNHDVSQVPPVPLLLERTERVCREVNCAYGGYSTASDLARLYAAMLQAAAGQAVRGLPTSNTVQQLVAGGPPTLDVVLERSCGHGLGFMTSLQDHGFGSRCSESSFGHSGWLGGTFAFADPAHGLAVGVVMNGMLIGGDSISRRFAVVDALYDDLGLG